MGIGHPFISNHRGRSADACCEVTVFERAGGGLLSATPPASIMPHIGWAVGPGPGCRPGAFVLRVQTGEGGRGPCAGHRLGVRVLYNGGEPVPFRSADPKILMFITRSSPM